MKDEEIMFDYLLKMFKRSTGSNILSYEVKLPYDISLEMINNIYPEASFFPSLECTKNVKFRGWTLKYFTDLFFILFDNIVKHSNIKNLSNSVNCKMIIKEDNLGIEIQNIIKISGKNYRQRINDFKNKYTYSAIPEYRLQKDGKIQDVDILLTISEKINENDCCYLSFPIFRAIQN